MSRQDVVGIAKQTAQGTGNATPEFYVPVSKAEVGVNQENVSYDETTGTRYPQGQDYGVRYFEPSLEGAVRVASFGRLLSAYFGAPSTSGTDPYEHVFTPDGSPLWHSLLLHREDAGVTDRIEDVLGNELELSCEPNGYLVYKASLLGLVLADPAPSEPSSPTLDTSSRVRFDEVVAYLNVDGAGEAAIKVGGFSLTFSNGIETDGQEILGQRDLYSLDPGNAGLELTFSPRESLSSHYRRALLDAPEDCALRLVATAGSDILEVSIPRVQYLTAPADIDASERTRTLEVAAAAAISSSGDFVTVTLTNSTASY